MPEVGGVDARATQARLLASRLFQASLGAAELMAAYLGLQLGLYEALAAGGPMTASMLASRAGIAERYAREWLEQQAVCGILEVNDATQAAADRLYLLPPGHAEALIDTNSEHCIAAIAMLPTAGMTQALPKVVQAYRDGTGVPYSAYGSEFHGHQAGLNRGTLLHRLRSLVKIGMPRIHAQLGRRGSRVADVGCGNGWASIALALAYPDTVVDGFDLHAASIQDARRNAAQAGVAGRTHFVECDAEHLPANGRYTLVCIVDGLHDMSQPVAVLKSCRAVVEEAGAALLIEPRAAEAFEVPASNTERFLYAISLLHCLPVGMAVQPSAATGTLLRPAQVRTFARQAGFADMKVIPVEHQMYRFYQLDPIRHDAAAGAER